MNTAIVLAAGEGRRMHTSKPKQFLMLDGQPLLVKSLRVFEDSPRIDRIILVTGRDYIDYCKNEIVTAYGLHKVSDVIEGGQNRYDSVYAGLLAGEGSRYVFIHDAARPYITDDIIERAYKAVVRYGACAVGMPAKDTIKIVDDQGFIYQTPPRSNVWIIQTPQAFNYILIKKAYDILRPHGMEGITDDAMVVEEAGLGKVKLVEGSYSNIKITTPEDLPDHDNIT